MQTLAKLKNAQSGGPDAAFYVVASGAKDASWTPSIVAVIRAWIAILFGSAVSLRPAEHQIANGALPVLQNHERVELLGGHARAPASEIGVVFGKLDGIAFQLRPYTSLIGVIVCLAGCLLFGLGVINFTGGFDIGPSIVGFASSQHAVFVFIVALAATSTFLFGVFVIVSALIGSVGFPLLGGAVALSHDRSFD